MEMSKKKNEGGKIMGKLIMKEFKEVIGNLGFLWLSCILAVIAGTIFSKFEEKLALYYCGQLLMGGGVFAAIVGPMIILINKFREDIFDRKNVVDYIIPIKLSDMIWAKTVLILLTSVCQVVVFTIILMIMAGDILVLPHLIVEATKSEGVRAIVIGCFMCEVLWIFFTIQYLASIVIASMTSRKFRLLPEFIFVTLGVLECICLVVAAMVIYKERVIVISKGAFLYVLFFGIVILSVVWTAFSAFLMEKIKEV
ncbi:MAG: hypothetical protein E7254_11555 [Lachnospiraceae bacterium]|nr:hypothetical protein [Lachnospiraceae bacterium]